MTDISKNKKRNSGIIGMNYEFIFKKT